MILCLSAAAAALLSACSPGPAPAGFERVTILGNTFTLELAADDASRFRGLSGRSDIPADGGMLFVFPDRDVAEQSFVMRECPVDIDIIFLSPAGRVTAMHSMKAEEPRRADEPEPLVPGGFDAYEARLKKYSSQGAAQFVIELRGGTLASRLAALKAGDKIEMDYRRLVDLAD